MIRDNKKYSPDEVLSKINTISNFDGYNIKILSLRYKIFKRSLKCINCGIKGQYFYKEKSHIKENYHFNLYANKNGNEILMTKDHIIPLSKNGINHINNLDTMCTICNKRKDNKLTMIL